MDAERPDRLCIACEQPHEAVLDSGQHSPAAVAAAGTSERPPHYHEAFVTAMSLALCFSILSAWIFDAVSETLLDGNCLRLTHIAVMPVAAAFMVFSCHTIFSSIACGVGPVDHMKVMVRKLYRRFFGGKCNIYVNDDGLMTLCEEKRRERIEYYMSEGIAYCSRPPSCNKGGYVRRGRFKKASNLNFALNISLQVEAMMNRHTLGYAEALQMLVEEGGGSFLAAGDVRIGDFILLVDSDTRVPSNCIAPTVTELAQARRVAYTQHLTTPLRVGKNYWEDAISHFTSTIYNVAIRIATSGGDMAPLVGHNVFLSWSAMKECAYIDEADFQQKFWSENHVSEDFDMALRFQVKGFHGRYVTYTGPGFQEGVSLTVHDEIVRFKKYSFGASELLFNPFSQWRKGPFSSQYLRYLASDTPWWSKVTVSAYLSSYLAISASWWLSLVHYFMYAWSDYWREEVVTSLDISVTVLVIFSGVALFGVALVRYRLGTTSLVAAVWEELRHVPIMVLFFNGISMHLFSSILSHLLDIDVEFGATQKEIKQTNFFQEMGHTLYTYKWQYALNGLFLCIVIGLYIAPSPWAIRAPHSIIPIGTSIFGHMMAPILLNPVLMRLKF
ncbi:unnamed protein product [Ostreobium quekettii]|uniref:Glycosyltransferase 2-like domain-containing protein n=1 Tax=Ostreobium quekettii TaxID=121088 RepID=A0A8S1ISI8_9CHLO|nr:unnamed protein product [Ostreobium quekettii]